MSTAATSSTQPIGVGSYQQVDGLQEIYVGLGAIPEASFVFETAEKASACAKAVNNEIQYIYTLATGQQHTNMNMTNLTELLRGANLSNKSEDRVLSYSAKQAGTVGKPMTTVHQLLDRIGKAMKRDCPCDAIKAVPIYGVDSLLYSN